MKTITLDRARAYVDAALDLARQRHVRIAVAVVDRGGHLVAAARMDDVAYLNLEVARRKANAAQILGAPLKAVMEGVGDDQGVLRAFAATADEMVVLPGGFPITEVVSVVGGLGIAGAHYAVDHDIGEAVIAKLVQFS
jgi:glc operon protein GlcG